MTDDETPQQPRLVAAPPPSDTPSAADIESYVVAAMHQDRRPGNVLAICHPLRMYKVPRGLLDALRDAGCNVEVVHTHPDRVTSITGIRDAMLAISDDTRPLDVLVISGDGSLDHHVLVAAFWAFYPELVTHREGCIAVEPLTKDERAYLPASYRRSLLDTPLDTTQLTPDEDTIRQVWLLRAALERGLRRGRALDVLARKVELLPSSPLFRVACLAALVPHRVTLRSEGFDLCNLASASREQTFQGLYPFVRAIACYPAGTAADNALYAGIPGYLYAQVSGILTRFAALERLRQFLERRAIERFVSFFIHHSAVVPARFSVVAFDGDWQYLSTHAVGGPGSGRIFAADLSSKGGGVLSYLLRLPRVVLDEGILGSTVVRIVARDAHGLLRSSTEAQTAESLYTNRTFIAGVGSVPSTNPTSFAGRSSLVIAPPIISRDHGERGLDFRGLFTLVEAIFRGLLGRALHGIGIDAPGLVGGGKLASAKPQHQVSLTEGEELRMDFLTFERRPRFAPTQVSGDPFQATTMAIRAAWGPIPLLGAKGSLLLASARRSLADLRLEQTYHLQQVYIGGLRYFRHLVGEDWTTNFIATTGLLRPPMYLPRRVSLAQKRLIEAWTALGTGPFMDTTESGMGLGRRGRYAHNNDQSAHLVVIRAPGGRLVVRQARVLPGSDVVHEAITTYQSFGPSYVIDVSQTRGWPPGDTPRLLQEEHYFRSARDFRQDAPRFFPFVARGPDRPTAIDVTEEVPR